MFPLAGSFVRARDDFRRNAAHRGAVHPEAALGEAVFESVQEGDGAGVVIDDNLHPLGGDFGVAGELRRQAAVVGREEAEAADVRGDVVQDCFGDGNTVVGGCAAAEFVEDDE